MFPFKEEKLSEQLIVREFRPDVPTEELVWHRDREDRLVEVIEPGGWWFQIDDELPQPLQKGSKHFIKACTWHRVIRTAQTTGTLVVKIQKLTGPF
jgi:hypothetical protein